MTLKRMDVSIGRRVRRRVAERGVTRWVAGWRILRAISQSLLLRLIDHADQRLDFAQGYRGCPT